MTSTVTLRNMEPSDWPSVRRIYQEGIDTGQATFETQAPGWDSFDRSRLPGHRHVAASTDGQVLGWAAASPTSSRPAYAGVVEHSIYVTAEACGFGLGKALLNALINSTESAGIRTIQATVFPEMDPASASTRPPVSLSSDTETALPACHMGPLPASGGTRS
ncbi:UNVERIFIED_ORG: phosphinothricin acetyltransferase [Arthrobacter sp. UYEF1]